MPYPEWPEAEIMAMRRGDSFYEGAAICRRGHVETRILRPGKDRPVPERCPKCGANVLAACPECGIRIRGALDVPGFIGVSKEERPSFCDGCGVAFPWASREERIFELENLLDEEDVDEADRVVISAHLQRLRDATLSEKDERAAWEGVKSRAGKAITSGPVQRVLEGLVSAAIRNQLGI